MSRYYDNDWPPPSRPRRPANGIRAETQRGKFGKTWWASRWIAALERLVDAGRLARGRSYARSGQVVSLDIKGSAIAARVQGSRPSPYRVSITFKPLSDPAWEQVVDAMAGAALYAARLLSGEMPEQIEEVFTAAGSSLFPDKAGDLQTDCSCPDYANPCKHVAAVHYLLGERFDADPFLIFALRGRTKEAIIAALRARRAGAAAEATPAAEAPAPATEPPPPLEAAPDVFWSAAEGELSFRFEPPPADALAVKRLGEPPFWRGQPAFLTILEEAYRAIGDRALRLAIGEE
jgi:uncharacterized Zn finger protein